MVLVDFSMITIIQKMNTPEITVVEILQNGIAAIERIAARRDQMMMSSHMCEMVFENLLRDIFVRRSSDWEKMVNMKVATVISRPDRAERELRAVAHSISSNIFGA